MEDNHVKPESRYLYFDNDHFHDLWHGKFYYTLVIRTENYKTRKNASVQIESRFKLLITTGSAFAAFQSLQQFVGPFIPNSMQKKRLKKNNLDGIKLTAICTGHFLPNFIFNTSRKINSGEKRCIHRPARIYDGARCSGWNWVKCTTNWIIYLVLVYTAMWLAPTIVFRVGTGA